MRKSMTDILAAAAVLALAAAFYAQTGKLRGLSLYFPRMLIIFLAVGGLFLLGKGVLGLKKEQARKDAEPVAVKRVLLISAGSVVYVLLIPALGFYPASALFLFVMAFLLRHAGGGTASAALACAVFTLIVCASVWAGFALLLGVPTPEGLLFQS